MTLLDDRQITPALAGMPYPARRRQLVTWSGHNCASQVVLDAPQRLPDLEYTHPRELIETLETVRRWA
jgi:hypothetical protein